MTLKAGISGVRGIVGESLTEEGVSDFSKAFASYIGKGTVIVGRDTRPSGIALEKTVISSLIGCGINVLYAGISATPTMQVLVQKLKADGGIVITASHNPIEWNGMKFIDSKGVFLNAKQNKKLFDLFDSKEFKSAAIPGNIKDIKDPDGYHIDAVLKCVDVKKIRAKKFRVALDSVNGAGSVITPRLLKLLGCEVVEINTDTEKEFARGAEPIAENLADLCRKVKAEKADIGFAQDPDADRLAVVSDRGEAIGEEYSMVLAAEHVLPSSKKGSTVVTNLSTSRMIDDVAKKYGAKVVRTKVGEINVVEKLIEIKAVMAGEGNGGVIYPKVVSSRDSLTGMALILNMLAERGGTISSIVAGIPKYYMIKTKIECRTKEEVEHKLERAKKNFKGVKTDTADGIKFILPDSWMHIRSSNTEPIVRVIAEAKSMKKARDLVRKASA